MVGIVRTSVRLGYLGKKVIRHDGIYKRDADVLSKEFGEDLLCNLYREILDKQNAIGW